MGHVIIQPFQSLLDTTDFPARWYCGNWSTLLGWCHIASDTAIWGAYLAIPLVIVYYVRQKGGLPYPRLAWLFAAFILCCGFTHLIEASIFWWPAYRLSGLAKVLTAVVSWATVAALVKTVPQALEVPVRLAGMDQLERRVAESSTRLEETRTRLEEKRAESRELRADLDGHEALMKTFIEHVPAAIAMLDGEMRFISVSDRWRSVFDLGGRELRGTSYYDVFKDTPESLRAAQERCLETGETTDCVVPRVIADGRLTWIRWELRLWTSGTGTHRGLVVFSEDVTERKQAEERKERALQSASVALENTTEKWTQAETRRRDLEKRFRTTFEQAAVGIAHVSPSGQWLRVNDTLCRIVGYTRAELMGATFQEITHADDLQLDLDHVGRLLAGEITHYEMEKRYVRKDATLVSVLLTVALVRDGRGAPDYFISVVQDLTQLKRAEAALLASEKRLTLAFEHAPLPICIHDRGGEVVLLNRAWERLSGYGRGDIQTLRDWVALATGRKKGVSRTAMEKFFHADGRVREGEFRVRTRSGGRCIWDFTSASLGLSVDGRELVMSMATDVTLRHDQEHMIRVRNKALDKANKDLEYFAYVASHDLQEPLRSIAGYVQLLQRRHAEKLDEQALRYIDRTVGATARMQTLIKDLLAFSRVSTHGKPFARVDLDEVMSIVVEDLGAQMERANAQVQWGNLPTVLGDQVQLLQLFQNLIGNAIKYHGEEPPEVMVWADSVEAGAGERFDEPVWRVHVCDNGIGIDSEYFDVIFNIFQRLHARDEYEGTGVGLSMCRRIVERHGGEITVQSTPGQGSVFSFTLPEKARELGKDG